MASLMPIVLEGADLENVIKYVLDHHASPSTVVVCSSKDAFMTQLQAAMKQNTDQGQPWTTPTLRLLASAQDVKLAFCPDLTHLRAYLATYAYRVASGQSTPMPIVQIQDDTAPVQAIINPISLHRPTSAFSAQGLNRTLAIAVDAAHNTQSRLILAECNPRMDEETSIAVDEGAVEVNADSNPWDEEVSILNVTTKSFGAGERGWVGRTVAIRTIAQRWCIFQTLPT